MHPRGEENLIPNGQRPTAARAWLQPQLSVLGEVASLTETGSMANNEGGNDPYVAWWRCNVSMNNLNSTGMC